MSEQDYRSYPRTYHSPRAQAIYEQCVWDREHVLAIYPILSGVLAADGVWHEIATPVGVGRYRVFEERYFQAVYAAEPTPVFEALASMDAVETEDDAEWAIWELENGGGYAMSSTFALTPGPFDHQEAVDAWLWRHGLALEPREFHVEGVAYFVEIEPGCLRDAMDRLVWLEHVFEELNEELDRAGSRFWKRVEKESDLELRKLSGPVLPDEIAPLPERYGRSGWKRREAVRGA